MREKSRGLWSVLWVCPVVLALSTPTLFAQTWDWTLVPTTPRTVDAHPLSISQPDASGFWALGDSLLRYNADASLSFAQNHRVYGAGLNAILSDGTLIHSNVPAPPTSGLNLSSRCSIVGISPQGDEKWARYLAAETWCVKLKSDAHDVIWTQANGSVYGVAADGVPLGTDSVGGLTVSDFAADKSGGGVFVTVRWPPVVAAFDDHQVLQWTWNDPVDLAQLDRIQVDVNGNLLVVGRSNYGNDASMHVVSLTPNGAVRFSKDNDLLPAAAVLGLGPAANGSAFVLALHTDTTTQVNGFALIKIDASGTAQWDKVLGNFDGCSSYLPDCGLASNTDGDALFEAELTQSEAQSLLRFDSNGNLLHSVPLAPAHIRALANVAGKSALAALSTVDSQSTFMRLDRTGTLQTAPVTKGVLAKSIYQPVAFDDDGSSYFADSDASGRSIVKIGTDGRQIWRTKFIDDGGTSYAISVGGNRVCEAVNAAPPQDMAASARPVACYSSDTGAFVWTQSIVPSAIVWATIRTLSDGSLYTLFNGATRIFDPDGTLVANFGPIEFNEGDLNSSSQIAADGSVVFMLSDNSRLLSFDRTGMKKFDVAVPAEIHPSNQVDFATVKVLDDGSAIVTIANTSATESTPYAWRVRADGTTAWMQALAPVIPFGPLQPRAFQLAAKSGIKNTIFFLWQSIVDSGADHGQNTVTLQAREDDTGKLRWTTPVNSDYFQSVLAVNPGSGNVALISGQLNKVVLTSIDVTTGSVFKKLNEACSDDVPLSTGDGLPYTYDSCSPQAAAISPGDVLRLETFSGNTGGPSSTRLFGLRDVTAGAGAVRIDQKGLDGSWYAPYSGGQGFALEYIDSAKTIFMPWFTFAANDGFYALSGVDDPSGLAWYALQGSVSTGAATANMLIARTDPGTFDSGQVGPQVVGTALLQFSDCNNGTLYYQFNSDTNDGLGGLITLSRLTPSTSPCELADTSIIPAQNTNPPRAGFDSAQSGSWFDPATGGQGVEVAISPAGNGSNGLVFVSWFTFDPDGAANDPAHQQWFTLQGDLSGASDGNVTLPIYEILNGAFDSATTRNFSKIGHATIQFTGCDQAQFDYQFDDNAVAHAFAGLHGTQHWIRLGACTAP